MSKNFDIYMTGIWYLLLNKSLNAIGYFWAHSLAKGFCFYSYFCSVFHSNFVGCKTIRFCSSRLFISTIMSLWPHPCLHTLSYSKGLFCYSTHHTHCPSNLPGAHSLQLLCPPPLELFSSWQSKYSLSVHLQFLALGSFCLQKKKKTNTCL